MAFYIRRHLLVLALALVVSEVAPASAQDLQSDAILGTWANEDETLVIEIYRSGGTYSARFVYGALLVEADGRTLKKDEANPDPALRSRSLAEVNFLSGLSWDASDQRWEDGTLYQAATGNTGLARVTMDGTQLNLRAYRGTPLAGRTIIFNRQND
jgi:uncharacterized protein (DUF2147 family)